MIGERIEDIIKTSINNTLNKSTNVDMPSDIIETDNIGEVIEKLSILHCRMVFRRCNRIINFRHRNC